MGGRGCNILRLLGLARDECLVNWKGLQFIFTFSFVSVNIHVYNMS